MATDTFRDRNRSSGIIGCAPRAWATTKAASASTATRKAVTTCGAAKPTAPASIAPYVSPPIARTAVTWPTQEWHRVVRRTRGSSQQQQRHRADRQVDHEDHPPADQC